MDDLTTLATIALVAGAVGVLAGMAVRRWGLFTARVESVSMEPTLSPGQLLLVRRLRGLERVRRGDIVVVDSTEAGRAVVKRAVGLPGDRVTVDRHGAVAVDDLPLVEDYALRSSGPRLDVQVPAGRLLLLGDNRARSSDSRSWRQPAVSGHAVIGRVIHTFGHSPSRPRTPSRTSTSTSTPGGSP